MDQELPKERGFSFSVCTISASITTPLFRQGLMALDDTPKDGNCWYHEVGFSLYRVGLVDIDHLAVRRRAIEYLQALKERGEQGDQRDKYQQQEHYWRLQLF